jgi:hypothetical protein
MKNGNWSIGVFVAISGGLCMFAMSEFSTTDDLFRLIQTGICAIVCLQFILWMTTLYYVSRMVEKNGNKDKD